MFYMGFKNTKAFNKFEVTSCELIRPTRELHGTFEKVSRRSKGLKMVPRAFETKLSWFKRSYFADVPGVSRGTSERYVSGCFRGGLEGFQLISMGSFKFSDVSAGFRKK